MDIKKIILTKKIDSAVYQVYPQTSADQVVYDNTTVAAKLAELASNISDITTDTTGTIDVRVKKACDDLYAKIMGVTDASQIDQAYDTLKEVADYLNAHGSVVEGFTSDIAALKEALGTAGSESEPATGLFADVAALATRMTTAEGLIRTNGADIDALEAKVGNENSGLIKDVADLKAAATNVVDSTTNGNIVVDGAEMVVYDDSAVTSRLDTLETTVGNGESGLVKDVADNAANIAELQTTVGDDASGLVKDVADNASAIAALQAGSATITYGTEVKTDLQPNELYFQIIG